MLTFMRINVSAERRMDVPAAAVYEVIRDYRTHHPRILPPQFSGLRVVEGSGIGAGTVIEFTLTLGGNASTARARVDEPQPGRVLTETDLDRDLRTTFSVEPMPGGTTPARFDTTWTTPGLRGMVERLMAPRMLRSIYAEELENLERVAQEVAAEATRTQVTASSPEDATAR
jgi:hypothetical protein